MSRYVMETCPYCKKVLDYGRNEKYFYSNYIGLSYLRCPKCKSIYSTGKKFYCNMTEKEQKKVKSQIIFNFINNLSIIIVVISVSCAILMWLLMNVIEFNFDSLFVKSALIAIIIFLFIISIVLTFQGTKSDWKEIKSFTISDIENIEELQKDNELFQLNMQACNSKLNKM